MGKFSDLPEELVMKIWSLLPAKSVLRLKGVQKSWNIQVNALVKTPSFVADHVQNSRATSSSFILTMSGYYSNGEEKQKLLTLHRDGNVEVIDNSNIVNASIDRSPNQDKTIFAHCDGMVCSVEVSSSTVNIWNPATGELRELRSLYGGDSIAVGFGYDPISRAYKLVVVSRHEGRIAAKVCTIGEEMWRQVETRAIRKLDGFDPLSKSAVCCGGVGCWIGRFGLHERVVYFDMNAEKFETASVPTKVDHPVAFWKEPTGWRFRYPKLRLARWMESVALLCDESDKVSPVDVWVMSKTNKSWIKRFSFCQPSDEVRSTGGLIFHDVLENKSKHICSGETINTVRLVPHLDYNFVALP